MESDEQLVARVPLLARLAIEDVRALAAVSTARRYAAGSVIVREGEPGDSLHTVMEGSVRISVASRTGEEATLAMLGPGECFGELSLLDGQPRSASAVATTPTRTLMVSRPAFQRWLAGRPTAALALLETLSQRVRSADQSLADMAFLDLQARLAKRLLDLAAQPGLGSPTGNGTRVKVTQAELAAMLGVSRESVNKQLNTFAREGGVSLGRGTVTITSRDVLARHI